MTDYLAYLAQVQALHDPPMTTVEEGLKSCLELRPELKGQILTGSEMADYVLWMIETFGEKYAASLGQMEIPSMLLSGGIPQIGQEIMLGPADQDAIEALVSLYKSSQETSFFLADQDISAGAFLRYFPAYWQKNEYFEVFYVYSGECPVFFEKESLTLHRGSVLIVPPGVRNAYCCMGDESCVHFFLIRKSTFSQVFWTQLTTENLMSHFFRQSLGGEADSPYLRFETGEDLRIETLLYAIYCEYNRNRKYSSQLLNALMSSFFLCLLQEHEETAQISKYSEIHWKPEFAGILLFLQENYRDVSLEMLSERFGYSSRQLMRIIQNSTGESFTSLQTRLRMERAVLLLRTGKASMEEIAYEIGFKDRASFYRAFRRFFGCTPGEYKERDQTDSFLR